MTLSVVAICNRAADYLGASPITSLEDPSPLAGLFNRNYPVARDTVLRSYPWNCATARAVLAATVDAPAWGYPYQFTLPVDCLRVLEIDGDIDFAKTWRIEGRRVLGDEAGPLKIRYIQRVEDPAQYDAQLADAIASRLAADIAYSVVGNAGQAAELVRQAEGRITQARRIDALEQAQDEVVTADDWLRARR